MAKTSKVTFEIDTKIWTIFKRAVNKKRGFRHIKATVEDLMHQYAQRVAKK